MPGILLVDNNCLDQLRSPRKRARLRANLRATGREFWPTAINVLEAVKSRDASTRNRLLKTLADLSGDNHPLTLPGEALRRVAEVMSSGEHRIDWAEPKLTRFFRYPDSVTDQEAASAREFREAQEASFRRAHDEARSRLRPVFREAGGHRQWATPAEFVEQIWLSPTHLQRYVDDLWSHWGFGPPPGIESVLRHGPWRLFFDGWGASVYAQHVEHPQRGKVQHSDIDQLVYLGGANSRILASDDGAFRELANSILRGRHQLAEVVPLHELL